MEIKDAESAREFIAAWGGRVKKVLLDMTIEGMRRCEGISRNYSRLDAAKGYAEARAVLAAR